MYVCIQNARKCAGKGKTKIPTGKEPAQQLQRRANKQQTVSVGKMPGSTGAPSRALLQS